jgi:RNA polymerase sigma factor (sigma-70 family)
MLTPDQVAAHLFRHEAGKLLAVLLKILGRGHLELAEDLVQETLLRALAHWKLKGVPQNPAAWLMQVAKRLAIDSLRHAQRRAQQQRAPAHEALPDNSLLAAVDQLSADGPAVEDALLRTMFACCHPILPREAQVALILQTLCGFRVAEIAKAFLTTDENIAKRLYRARQLFRDEQVPLELPLAAQLSERLVGVLQALYLLFNEGYHSTYHQQPVRADLAGEAARLAMLLAEHPATAQPQVFALLALMSFHAARFPTRTDARGHLLLLREQNRAYWDQALIRQGQAYLQKAASGPVASRYHLEAMIAHEHCQAPSYGQTDWPRILQLYDWLLHLQPDPVVALNRAVAVGEVSGPQAGIQAVENIAPARAIEKFYLRPAILAEFHARLGDLAAARQYWRAALELTQSPAEQALLQRRLDGETGPIAGP